MDTELFQVLALALLLVIAAVLVVAASSLARIRRSLEQRGSLYEPGFGMSTSGAGSVAGSNNASTPATAQASRTGEAESPARSESAAPASESQGEPPPSERRDRVDEEQAATSSGGEDEPQEQPFERDGRWWFKRGDELLVYDEQTGQWLPAPTSTGAASMTQVARESASGGVATETRTTALEDLSPEESDDSVESSTGFWKCPSCGAVNGSTATSCRMCFSARP